ncbi:hypothetical protein [Streptomyces sp. ME19-01-6]|uniref:hypothetical protein n=1 Tax=Streptomyces sp. ME19-01-6 TaxID=3028686 RepID=UPI0029B8E4A8|nr:hypothetical protein [Streptomyces sp. ME19-01-6]MDX3233008.1 hypothetical protein [Streptomyces sp. ME19-01-6]
MPSRKATERDEAKIAVWKDEQWPVIRRGVARHKRRASDLGAWLCFEDEAGQGLRPPKGRTWGQRGTGAELVGELRASGRGVDGVPGRVRGGPVRLAGGG